jgi:hypothetical protein
MLMTDRQIDKKTSRTIEIIFGIIGGIFGLIGAGLAFVLGAGFNVDSVATGGFFSIIFSIVSMIAVAFISKQPKIVSIILIIAALVLFITTGLFGALGAVLLFIGGVLGLIRK